jgi:aldehyde oxidoreductase
VNVVAAPVETAETGPPIEFILNSAHVALRLPGAKRLADVLRDDCGLTGTKIGCNAGDCGACTVMIDGRQKCACLVPLAQVHGTLVVTVEGLRAYGVLTRVQQAFQRHGAAQCGICTPGMLMAASDLLGNIGHPSEQQVLDALGGVLCRCTGYRKIVEAVLDAATLPPSLAAPAAGHAVGARVSRHEALAQVIGAEKFGADVLPADALWLRAVRSPHARARFTLGSFDALHSRHPGLVRVLTARDVPGNNGFGIYPEIKDQPVFAQGHVRFRGEAVCALVGDRATVEAIRDEELPIQWQPEAPVLGIDAAAAPGAALVQADKPGNVLVRGHVECGDTTALSAAAAITEVEIETSFVEHAYIEPEAGFARRVGDRVEIHAPTQSPYMARDENAQILGLASEQVRIVPTAVGGGFGGKLDQSIQPMIAIAAWLLGRPVACIYTRPESMMSTTKRHPARVRARFGTDRDGRLLAVETDAAFDTGAYASWGPTVASRVPVHAAGPYRVPNVRNDSVALFSNAPPSGAFRGFGVPQVALAHEQAMDDLAALLSLDRLEIRRRNALAKGDLTPTGQCLHASAGLGACLDALVPKWQAMLAEVAAFNGTASDVRRGAGIGAMWYGIGNTGMSNPSTMRVALSPDGKLTLHSGAVDIGQGSNTILRQICADALGAPYERVGLISGDTDLTADAGKTSASRQTYVSGKAVALAAADLRVKLLRLANAGADASLVFEETRVLVHDTQGEHVVRLGDETLIGEARFDPSASPLDSRGQGEPYPTYAFAAQIALVEVDVELGTTKVLRMVAAHDVGRAINPTLIEGQIHGGIAQGLGLALMEEYIPGRTENLHDYLIPTFGDVPPIEVILIEDPEPTGPFGAKGVGEPGLVPTAPAILGAIRHATGAVIRKVPATPDRVRAAILAAGGKR